MGFVLGLQLHISFTSPKGIPCNIENAGNIVGHELISSYTSNTAKYFISEQRDDVAALRSKENTIEPWPLSSFSG